MSDDPHQIHGQCLTTNDILGNVLDKLRERLRLGVHCLARLSVGAWMRFPDSLYPGFEFPDTPTPAKRGHAGQPGNGPKGETCKSCKHIYRRRLGKTYIKCGLNQGSWTGGAGSDIRAGDPACDFWVAA